MDVRVGLHRKLRAKKLMLLNCGVGEDSWESLGLQGDPTSPFYRKSVLKIHWKDWCWSWNSNIWPRDGKNWLTEKDPDAGKDWGQEEKGADEMVGCYPRLNAHDFEQTQIVKYRETWCAAVPGVTKSQAGLNSNNNSNRSDLFLWSSSENHSLLEKKNVKFTIFNHSIFENN